MFENIKQKLMRLHKSATVWFNGAAGIVVSNWDSIKENLPQIQQYVNEHTFKWIAIGLVAGNILLRFKTNKSLADK